MHKIGAETATFFSPIESQTLPEQKVFDRWTSRVLMMIILGVIGGVLFSAWQWWVVWAVVFGLVLWLWTERWRVVWLAAVMCAAGLWGAFSASEFLQAQTKLQESFVGMRQWEAVVQEATRIRNGQGETVVSVLLDDGPVSVLLRHTPKQTYLPHEHLRFQGHLRQSGAWEMRFLRSRGIAGVIEATRIVRLSQETFLLVVYQYAEALRARYRDFFFQQFENDVAALALGITIGEKADFSPALLQAFRDSGLVHIVVLSGSNIAIVALFLFGLTRFLLPRALAIVLAAFGVGVFVWFVGAEPPTVRAAIMGIISLLGILAYRRMRVDRVFLVTVAFLSVYNPLLWWSLSFQLTVVATAAIVYGVPAVVPWLWFVPETLALREIIAATIAVQLALTPLFLWSIGSVSLVAPLANALALPLLPIAMGATFGGFATAGFVAPASVFLLWIAEWSLRFFIAIARFCAELPGAVFEAVVPWWVLLGYGVLLLGLWWVLRPRAC